MSKSKTALTWISPKVIPGTPHKHHVSALSEILLINSGGKVVPGYYIKVLQNINNHSLQLKKGEGYFADMHENKLDNVLGYYPTSGINIPKNEALEETVVPQ